MGPENEFVRLVLSLHLHVHSRIPLRSQVFWHSFCSRAVSATRCFSPLRARLTAPRDLLQATCALLAFSNSSPNGRTTFSWPAPAVVCAVGLCDWCFGLFCFGHRIFFHNPGYLRIQYVVQPCLTFRDASASVLGLNVYTTDTQQVQCNQKAESQP